MARLKQRKWKSRKVRGGDVDVVAWEEQCKRWTGGRAGDFDERSNCGEAILPAAQRKTFASAQQVNLANERAVKARLANVEGVNGGRESTGFCTKWVSIVGPSQRA